jgi:deoxyribonuclease V
MLRGKHEPGWPDLVADWKRQQLDMRRRILVQPLDPLPRFVAGVDGAFSADKTTIFAAAVIYDREAAKIIEVAHAVVKAEFPYIPTFLSFREGPAVLTAIGKLRHPFGAVCFDGQGYAHPRRCGLASHMGVTLDVPALGVA